VTLLVLVPINAIGGGIVSVHGRYTSAWAIVIDRGRLAANANDEGEVIDIVEGPGTRGDPSSEGPHCLQRSGGSVVVVKSA
jgi:hypothetical protein